MSSRERRAWVALLSLCPVYVVYFAIQIGGAGLVSTMPAKLVCLALAAAIHAVGFGIGTLAMARLHPREDGDMADERDRAIETRSTRAAYFVVLVGMIVVGMVMPFTKGGWDIVNTALLVVVLTESLRQGLIVSGYRSSRLAY